MKRRTKNDERDAKQEQETDVREEVRLLREERTTKVYRLVALCERAAVGALVSVGAARSLPGLSCTCKLITRGLTFSA